MPDLIPWGTHQLTKLRDDMDRLFDDLLDDLGLPRAARPGGIDVTVDKDKIVVTIPLPGYDPGDVNVTVSDRALSVDITKEERGSHGSRTLTFSREVSLPCPVDPETAEAAFKGGALTVTLKHACAQPARKIPIANR